jgi:hypothetical protein
MAVFYDKVKEQQERIQDELEKAQNEQSSSAPNTADTISVRYRNKPKKDRVAARVAHYGRQSEKAQAVYRDKGVRSKSRSTFKGTGAPAGVGYVLEGNYPTKADVNSVKRNYKATHFATARRLSDGTYNLWIKERGVGGKSTTATKVTKSYDLKGKIREFASKDRSIEGPGTNRWSSFGTLPEYKPPNFKLDQSGYKPLDYKPIDNAPMFKPTGFKTMEYKPIGTEAYYKPSKVGSEPYYKKSEYVPIGQFGGSQTRSYSEPVKRKRKKSKEPRLIGE